MNNDYFIKCDIFKALKTKMKLIKKCEKNNQQMQSKYKFKKTKIKYRSIGSNKYTGN